MGALFSANAVAPVDHAQTIVGESHGAVASARGCGGSTVAEQDVPGAVNVRWAAADDGRSIILSCQLDQVHGASSTGKTITVACSRGNRELAKSGLFLSFNAYLKLDTSFNAHGLKAFKPWSCRHTENSLHGRKFHIRADVTHPGTRGEHGKVFVVASTGSREVGKSGVFVSCNLMTKTSEPIDFTKLRGAPGDVGEVEVPVPRGDSRRPRHQADDVADNKSSKRQKVEDTMPRASSEMFAAAFFPPRSSLDLLRAAIADATTTLEVAIFSLTDDLIAEAIIARHSEGVKVRIIADAQMEEKYKTTDLPLLRKAGIPVRLDDSLLHMHHKFAIVDGRAVVNGSFNWTTGAMRNNKENFVVNRCPKLARHFLVEFDRLWATFSPKPAKHNPFAADAVFEGGCAVLCFPDRNDFNFRMLIDELRTAKSTFDAAVFTLTLPEAVAAMIDAHGRGVRVRVITDNQMAKVHHGEHIAQLRKAGIEVRTDHSPAQMHHKFAVIDGKTLINGSFNWTRQAEDGNQENLIIYRNQQKLAGDFASEFQKLWSEFA